MHFWFVSHSTFFFVLFCLIFLSHSRSLYRGACAALREEDLQLHRLSLKEQQQKQQLQQQQQQQKQQQKQPMLVVGGTNSSRAEPPKVMKLRSSGYGPKPSSTTSTSSTARTAAVAAGKCLVTSFPRLHPSPAKSSNSNRIRNNNYGKRTINVLLTLSRSQSLTPARISTRGTACVFLVYYSIKIIILLAISLVN